MTSASFHRPGIPGVRWVVISVATFVQAGLGLAGGVEPIPVKVVAGEGSFTVSNISRYYVVAELKVTGRNFKMGGPCEVTHYLAPGSSHTVEIKPKVDQ